MTESVLVVHVRILAKDADKAFQIGQEIREKYGCGYRVFGRKGKHDECCSPMEEIDYTNKEIEIH